MNIILLQTNTMDKQTNKHQIIYTDDYCDVYIVIKKVIDPDVKDKGSEWVKPAEETQVSNETSKQSRQSWESQPNKRKKSNIYSDNVCCNCKEEACAVSSGKYFCSACWNKRGRLR